MAELKPNGLVSANIQKNSANSTGQAGNEVKPNGLVSANIYQGERNAGKKIESADANGDGIVDIRDLVAAKKQTVGSSGAVQEYNKLATKGITERLLSPTYSDSIRNPIMHQIEKISNGEKLSENEFNALKLKILSAQTDNKLTDDERQKYTNLYATLIGSKKATEKDFNQRINSLLNYENSQRKSEYDKATKWWNDYDKLPRYAKYRTPNGIEQTKGKETVPPKKPEGYKDLTAKDLLINNFQYYTGKNTNTIYSGRNVNTKSGSYTRANSDYEVTGLFKYLTEGQAMDALYIFEKTYDEKGKTEAQKAVLDYLNQDEIKNGMGEQKYAEELKKAKSEFAEHSFLEKVGLNAYSVAYNVIGKPMTTIRTIQDQIAGVYDPYQNINIDATKQNYIRSFQTDEIKDAIRGHDETGFVNVVAETAGFLYNAGMMVVDNVVGYYLYGGNATSASFNLLGKVPFAVMPYTVSMGLGAYGDSVNEGYRKGLSKFQIVSLSVISGLAETLTEGFGMEAFANFAFRGKGSFIKSAVAEGSEEIVSNLANDISDIAIAGNKSDFYKSVEEYKAKGLSESKAVGRTIFDMGMQYVYEAGSAAVSVGIGGIPMAVNQYVVYKQSGQKVNEQNNAIKVRDIALSFPKDSNAFQTAKKYQNKEKLSDYQTGKILVALKQEINNRINKKVIQSIENRLNSLGVEDAENKAQIIWDMMNLEEVSEVDKDNILNDEKARSVYEDMTTEHTSEEQESEELQWVTDLYKNTETDRAAKISVDLAVADALPDDIAPKIISLLSAGERDENINSEMSGVDNIESLNQVIENYFSQFPLEEENLSLWKNTIMPKYIQVAQQLGIDKKEASQTIVAIVRNKINETTAENEVENAETEETEAVDEEAVSNPEVAEEMIEQEKSESGFEEVSVKENSEPKERNTPGRINGLASPVGNLIRKGVSNDSLPNSPETIKENVDNSENSGQTDERTAVFRSPEKIKSVSEHIVDVAKKIDKDLEIVFVDKIHNPDGSVKANANGRYDRKNNRLYLKKGIDTSTAYVELFKHELMHYLEGKKAYGDFKNYLFDNSMAFEAYCRFYVRQTVGEDFAESRDELFDKVKETYKKKGYKPQDIEYEMVADFFKHCLLRGAEGRNQIKNTLLSLSYDKKMPAIDNETDLDIIGELAKKQTSLLQKIKDFFAGIIERLTAKLPQFSEKRELIEDLAYLDDRIGRVLRSGAKNETLDQADRYMLKHDNRGNKYWQIETKDDIFNGLTTTDEYQKAAFDYILNARDNNTVVHAIDGKKMKFIRLSAEEFTNSEASKDLKATDKETYKRKMRMLPSLESILLNANVNWQSPDFKNHNLFKENGFENYRGKVRIDNIIFNTVVIAGKARFGDVFYDINLEVDQILPHGDTASEIKRSTSADNSISNNSENVNENFEENSEEGDNRYSLDGEDLQSEGGEDDEITYDPTWAINHNWDKAVEEYGAIKENSEIQTPKSVDGKKLVSQAVDNLLNHIRFTDEQLTAMKGSVLSGDDSYKILSDKTAENYAKKCMKEGTAVTKWNQAIQGGFVTKREIAIGIVLLKSAVEAGDIKEALEIKTDLREVATRSAQAVQAFSLVSKMSGIEKLYTMQKMVDKLNADIDERFKRKQNKPHIKINRQLAQELAKAESGENTDIITKEIMLDIAKQVPPTFMDKWNTWRYFCMLFNPTTHVRNIVGNCLFVPAVRVKDAIGALIESTRPEGERTKSLVIKKEYKVFAKKILKTVNVQKALGAISKYSDEEGLFKFKEAFANGIIGEKVENIPGLGRVDKTLGKTIQTGVDINSALLSLEDIWFKNLHFVHAMAGFLQARNVDLNAEIDGAVLTEATDYAVKEAMKATFNDASKLANRLSKWSSESLGADIAINSVLPFKRTPINIVKRGVEYSPIGLLKQLTVGIYDLRNGKISATEFIDGLSAGISGTIPLLVGYWLGSIGLANAGFGDDDEDKIKKLTGEQANSIKLFGKSYTLDWAAPACIPFFIGVTASNLKEDENLNFANSLDTIANALSPITEMSCLNGISDVINDLSYGEGGSDNWVQNLGATVISNYISQGFPTIGGKIASTIDETQRQNYYDKNNTILSKTTQETLQNIQSKIPGLSSKRIEKVDAWGRTVKTENVGARIFYNFISPGNYKQSDYNEVNNEIKRLFKKTGDAQIPSAPPKYFEYNGKRKDLTAKEYVQVEKYMGQGKFGIVSEMIKSEKYKTLSDEEKSLAIKRAYDYVNARVKKEYTGAAMYKWQEIVNEKYDFIKEASSKNYMTIAEVIIGRVISEK